jgi:hypothetical protein
VAVADSIRVFRGIYSGFALAMSEATEGLNFDELPSSDELANRAHDLTSQIIQADDRGEVPAAQQEVTAMLVTLAILEHQGKTDELTAAAVGPALDGLWKVVGGNWAP